MERGKKNICLPTLEIIALGFEMSMSKLISEMCIRDSIQHVEFKFYPILLRALQSGDEVEFIAEFDSFRRDPSDHYAGETMSFQGIEIRKVPH